MAAVAVAVFAALTAVAVAAAVKVAAVVVKVAAVAAEATVVVVAVLAAATATDRRASLFINRLLREPFSFLLFILPWWQRAAHTTRQLNDLAQVVIGQSITRKAIARPLHKNHG